MMTSLKRQALIPHHAKQMFDLVNDIDRYPEFLPWCSNASILGKAENELTASVEISAMGICKSFTTKNTLVENKSITMEHVTGPFKHLVGIWKFKELGDKGCKIELELDFEVGGGLKGAVFGMVFNKAADKLVSAFSERAKDLFG